MNISKNTCTVVNLIWFNGQIIVKAKPALPIELGSTVCRMRREDGDEWIVKHVELSSPHMYLTLSGPYDVHIGDELVVSYS
jgi:hypothetical protein